MSLVIRSGAVALTAVLAFAGCSSSDDTSAEDSGNPICAAMEDYMAAYNEKLASFGPEIQTASQEEQEKAQQELLDVMAEQTRLLAEQVPDDAPDDVKPAIEDVAKGMEDQSNETPELTAANETITNYVDAECPGLFPDPSAPTQPDTTTPEESETDSE